MEQPQRRPSGIAQDQAFQRFRAGSFDVDRMLADQHESAGHALRNVLVAALLVAAIAVVLAIFGSNGVTFMASITVALLFVAGILALVRGFT